MPCLILHRPQIPPNTGNIIRLAANCGFDLHLIEPLGFSLDEKAVRRAGMDYRELAHVTTHSSLEACIQQLHNPRLVIISTKAQQLYHTFQFSQQDALLFGNEGAGLPEEVWRTYNSAPTLRLPMQANSRSLNLSNAVAVIAYSCWQQLGFAGA